VDDRSQIRSVTDEDARTESAVLQYILAFHPVQTSLGELLREFDQGSGDITQRDAVERAVRNGEIVLPTRAALRFDQLLSG
jgi:hypothetical protein